MINRHSQTKYFILDPTVDHTNGGAAINAPLYNNATTALNILVGSGLFYNPVAGSGNHAEINAAPGSAGNAAIISANGEGITHPR